MPQDLTSLGGKILRIDPNTGGPAAGNPRPNAANPNTRLMWNYGHRNPQGLALRPNGQMFNVEHGSYRDDEVNRVLRDRNYGWDPIGRRRRLRRVGADDRPAEVPRTPDPPRGRSGPTTDATSGATFLVGTPWKSWNGSLVVAQLQGQSLLRLTLNSRGQLTGEELIPEFSGTYGRLRTAQLGTDGSLYLTTATTATAVDVILKVTPTG
ncbi:MAG: PQQ-dependent sugar dehydrogenase [Geodermatophilaceae bacterium]